MGLRIQHNMPAMNAHRQLTISDTALSKSLERLSSGYRINRAADDAAGLAISQSFRADIASFRVASRNTSEAAALLQVGEGAMDQIGNMLTRLKELATQAASANAGNDLDKIEAEKVELLAEINRIANVTEYAGAKLLNGTFGANTAAWDTDDLNLDTTNGYKWALTDAGADTTTVSFSFSSSIIGIATDTYSLTTSAGAGKVVMTGDTNSEAFVGSYSGTTLTFSTIGLTIVGDSAFTSTMLDGDDIVISDIGYQSMTVSNSTATGTWTVADAGNNVTLTNGSESQVVATGAGPRTLDFDQLGIKITLDSGYAAGELNGFNFTVSSSGSNTFQVGAQNSVNDRVSISLGNATASGLGIADISFSTAAGAQAALDTVDSAISTLVSVRGNVGAAQNRLAYAASNLATTIENVQAAESVIRDVDMADEMTTFTKNQILLQAGTAMLAQANMAPQVVLQLMG